MSVSTIRPGLLVSLKTSIGGNNVSYDVADREAELESNVERSSWSTTRTVKDKPEYEAAKKARQEARHAVASVCVNTGFGLLCLKADSPTLDSAIAKAKKIAADFNATAKITRVGVYVLTGQVADTDENAMKALNSEVADLLATMERGVKNLDVKQIRDAAARAKSIGELLSEGASQRVTTAVEAAREAAKKIVKAGEAAAQEVDLQAVRKIVEARTAFLDLDGADKEVQAPTETGRALDLTPDPSAVKAAPVEGRALEV